MWVNFTFNHEALAAGTEYWFGIMTDGDFNYYYNSSAGHTVYLSTDAGLVYGTYPVLTDMSSYNVLFGRELSESMVFDVYVAPSPTATASGSYVAPTPTPASWTTGLSNYTDLIVAFFIILVPPLLVVVAVPKVGMAGFMTMFTATVCIGVFTLGMPFYFLILMAMMDVVMFYSMIQRG